MEEEIQSPKRRKILNAIIISSALIRQTQQNTDLPENGYRSFVWNLLEKISLVIQHWLSSTQTAAPNLETYIHISSLAVSECMQ